jgi:hypothetical protein
MNFYLKWFSVLIAVALADVCWTLYFIESIKKNAIKAGFWSASIIALGGYTIVEYTENRYLLTAAIIGAFIGTSLTVKFNKK